ncbi:MAG: hypothetical protein Unbinned4497contig1000_47 [Prokaryotic dsDNA virus sp.]|nr:MAG: hypothetical protein Unbinned4497contig1000_47 [Prokaryotic dsDNA virus sp.]|tara:strand:+ start:9611 stop:9886 length:276 start_codon:yes stop_codon:yes gene_type:complete
MTLLRAELMAAENWHLSKTIPITFLVGIIAQTFILGWLIADAQNTIETNSANIMRNQADIQVLENKVNDHAVMMGRIDENLKFLREYIEKQ